MKILVSGGTSQTARYLIPMLQADGHEIVSAGRSGCSAQWDLAGAFPSGLHQHFDAFCNLAGLSSVQDSFGRVADAIHINYFSVIKACEILLAINPRLKIIQAGSCEQIGNQYHQTAEQLTGYTRAPWSPYGLSKQATGEYCDYLRSKGYAATNLIIYNHDSRFNRRESFLHKVCRGIVEKRDLELGSLNVLRDYCHSSDVACAFRAALEHRVGEYQVGSGKSYFLSEVVERAMSVIGNQVKVNINPQIVPEGPYCYWAKIDNTKLALNWEPTKDLEYIIRDVASTYN